MRNKGAEQRGLAMAYEDGLPQEQIDKFDADEADLQATDSMARDASWAAQEQVCLHLLLGRLGTYLVGKDMAMPEVWLSKVLLTMAPSWSC